MIVIVVETWTIKGSCVDKNMVCRHDSLTEKIANLTKGKNVAIVSSHIKNAEEIANIFWDEYHVKIKNVSILRDHLLRSFLDNSKEANVEMLILALDEKPDRYFPEFFLEKYLKRVLYLEAFKKDGAWIIDLGKNTIFIINP